MTLPSQLATISADLRPGEIWVHAGATGDLKTMLALNVCYDQVIRGHNVVYMSSEHETALNYRMYALHSCHPKWGRPPLSYRVLVNDTLSSEEMSFVDRVREDFYTSKHGMFQSVFRPLGGSRLRSVECRGDAHLIVLDALVSNESIPQEMVDFAQASNARLLVLSQIGRHGRARAGQTGGVYPLSAIRAEVSHVASVITTTFGGADNRAENTVLICNLKNRSAPLFQAFKAEVDFTTLSINGRGLPDIAKPRPVYSTAWERLLDDNLGVG